MNAPLPGLAVLKASAQATGLTGSPTGIDAPDRKLWGGAAGIALTIHVVALAGALLWARQTPAPVEEPVVLVELPPEAAPAPQSSAVQSQIQPQPVVQPVETPRLPVDVPQVRAPLPREIVTLPPPAPTQPVRAAAPSVSMPQPVAQAQVAPAAPPANGSNTAVDASNDPKAKKTEADYKALVGSYIRRNKFSPPQARKAGVSGETKVRFVVHRDGSISDVGVAGSSGSSLLDGEAVQFLQRLTPVPSFPRDLRKPEIPLTITLKFALESK